MEKYIVSARKYRPSTFKSIVGQHSLAHTLKNAVITGRLAHSYLFCGQRGVGKTTTARIFAKAINCEHLTADGEPCNECESCRAFNEGRSLNIVELDAASNNSVDDIRQLIDQVRVPPVSGKYRVFIIDEVHMLSSAAFNAFLKNLEEPPSYVIFLLATTEKQKILPTILSRCQKYDFQSITPADIAEQLQYVADHEGYTTEPAALHVIAQKADGAMRDALSIFDQVAAASMGHITYQATIDNLNILDYDYYFRLVDAFLSADVVKSLLIYKEVRDHGFDSKIFINGVASHLRSLLMAHSPELLPMLDVSADIAAQFQEQSKRCSLQFLYAAMDLCNTCDLSYRDATSKQFLVELTLIKICQLCGTNPPGTGQQKPQPLQKIEKSQQQPQPEATEQKPTSAAPGVPPTATAEPKTAYTPTPRPAVAAKPAVNPSTVKVTTGISIPSISLKDVDKPATIASGSTSEAPTTQPKNTQRNEPYTEEQFQQAWRDFVVAHNKEIILANTMMAGFPEKKQDGSYLLMVENQAQVEVLDRFMPELAGFLRNRLRNDSVSLNVQIRASGEREKLWTQKELLLDMVERSPKVRNFIDKYRLGFA